MLIQPKYKHPQRQGVFFFGETPERYSFLTVCYLTIKMLKSLLVAPMWMQMSTRHDLYDRRLGDSDVARAYNSLFYISLIYMEDSHV
jgi:hypothetical protein